MAGRVSPSRLLAGCLCAVVAACDTTPIEIHDQGAPQFGGRAVWRAKPDQGASGSWFGLEVDGATVAGDDEQDLQAGETLELDGESITGPARVESDYRLSQASFSAVFGNDFADAVSMRLLLGAGWQELDLELDSGAQHADGRDDWWGLLTGIEGLWCASEWAALAARATWTTDLEDVESRTRVIELGVQLAPRALFAGWRWVDLERFDLDASDVDLQTNGPSLGLRVGF